MTAETEVRRRAARALSEWIATDAQVIRIAPAGPDDRRPVAWAEGRVLPADVSLSHDGRWLAWALMLYAD
jgi:hypothetical protein